MLFSQWTALNSLADRLDCSGLFDCFETDLVWASALCSCCQTSPTHLLPSPVWMSRDDLWHRSGQGRLSTQNCCRHSWLTHRSMYRHLRLCLSLRELTAWHFYDTLFQNCHVFRMYCIVSLLMGKHVDPVIYACSHIGRRYFSLAVFWLVPADGCHTAAVAFCYKVHNRVLYDSTWLFY